MTDTKYTYSLATDFGGELLISNLFNEVEASTITVALSKTLTAQNADVVDIWFKAALSGAEETTLDAVVAAHDATPVNEPQPVTLATVQVDADGSLLTAQVTPAGSEALPVSHDFCDKTTWYSNAEAVVGAEATETDATHFQLPDSAIIDVTHGKVYDEDKLLYPVTVYVDDVEMTEDEYDGATHDYSLNYATGEITFAVSQTGKAVTADYHKATDSIYKIIPLEGKTLEIVKAEIQFSADFDLKDTFQFQVWHPQAGVVEETNYKTMRQIIMEAFGVFPEMPAMGGANRGTGQKYYNLPFHYTRKRSIPYGLQIWIRLKNDLVCGGEHASVTFHCSVANIT